MNADKYLISAMNAEFKKYNNIEKVLLFGSRARGDNSELSDYDIAVCGNLSVAEKSLLHYIFGEALPTLHKIDLIFMSDIKNPEFKANIEKEGIKIYG